MIAAAQPPLAPDVAIAARNQLRSLLPMMQIVMHRNP
jgi:hypothetical protein